MVSRGLPHHRRPPPPAGQGREGRVTTAGMPAGTLSTAGLGDVVPTTSAAKLFLACYAPLAVCAFARAVGAARLQTRGPAGRDHLEIGPRPLGAVALRPLDRARRRAQRAVLERYRGRLTPRTFDEASAPSRQREGGRVLDPLAGSRRFAPALWSRSSA